MVEKRARKLSIFSTDLLKLTYINMISVFLGNIVSIFQFEIKRAHNTNALLEVCSSNPKIRFPGRSSVRYESCSGNYTDVTKNIFSYASVTSCHTGDTVCGLEIDRDKQRFLMFCQRLHQISFSYLSSLRNAPRCF